MNMIPPLDYGESVEQQAFWGAISICVFSKECQIGDQPSKYISTALARLAVLLVVEGGVRSTQIINQSKYAAAMSEEAREEYFAGKAMYRKEGRFERWMLWHPNTTVPVLPGVTLDTAMIMEHWMEPGDILMFNTCLWHRSPPWAGPEVELGLQPTFAPSTHISHDPPMWADPLLSWCLNEGFEDKAVALQFVDVFFMIFGYLWHFPNWK